jgi:hypothetical protein
MNLNEWRKRREEERPRKAFDIDGMRLVVGHVRVDDMLFEGEIPTPLPGMLTQDGEKPRIDMARATKQELQNLSRAIAIVVKAAAIDPPVADEPSETAIGIKEIPARIRSDIFAWCASEVAAMEKFREGPDASADTVADEPVIPQETV